MSQPSPRFTELRPIRESTEDFEVAEARMKRVFREHVYFPLISALGLQKKAVENAAPSALEDAVRTGRITYHRGVFSGQFSAAVSRELRRIGARWHSATSTYRIRFDDLPREVQANVAASDARFAEKLKVIDKRLEAISPEELADRVQLSDCFDRAIWRTEKAFEDSVSNITIKPALSADQRKTIADEWQQNMRIYIKDFAQEQIKELRARIQESAFKGDRYGSAVKTIQESYGVSANKAKFLARQETSLLMAKYKEVRYKDYGVRVYRWHCVSGTAAHPVRPTHLACKNKYFTWDLDSEVTADGTPKPGGQKKPGENLNPGEDYNCRCNAIPVVSATAAGKLAG